MVRTKPNEVVNAIKDGLQRAAQAGRTRARTGNAVPLLFILLGAQKHYICLCARRTQRIAPDDAPAELDTDWDDVCRLCGRAGELICCDGAGCPRAYHPKCVGLGEDGAEDLETWRCPECTSRDLSSYSSFEHDVELLWMDSQIDRPVSERMLAVDRRTAGRNASLFHRFVTAARAESSPDPLDEDEVGGASQAAGARGGRRSSLRAQEEEEEEPAKARRRSSSRAAVVPRKPPTPHHPTTPTCSNSLLYANRNRDRVLAGVSERQIMDRLAEKNWRDEGHPLVGQRVRRFLGGDRAANGRIIQWLPAGRYFPSVLLGFQLL